MSKITDWLLRLSALAIVVLGLKAAADLVTQILVIVFIAVIISPIYYTLRRFKMPDWLSISLIIISMVCFTFFGILGFIIQTIQTFADNLFVYYDKFLIFLRTTTVWLGEHDIIVPVEVVEHIKKFGLQQIMPIFSGVAPLMLSIVQQIIVILIIVSFILCELPSLPKKVKSIYWVNEEIYNRLLRVVLDIRHYMGIKTIISAITGILIWLGLMILGIPYAEILGIIAFILNFVPVFGSVVAAVIAIVFAMINSASFSMVVYISILYLVVNQVLGNILEPKFMGKGFGISPVIVLLAVIVWGWILGPIGMLLAVPLTMAVKSSIDSLKVDDLEKKKEKDSKHSFEDVSRPKKD